MGPDETFASGDEYESPFVSVGETEMLEEGEVLVEGRTLAPPPPVPTGEELTEFDQPPADPLGEIPEVPRLNLNESEEETRAVPRSGPEFIRWAQRALVKMVGTRLRPTGQLDAPTRAAVTAFQRRFGLPPTGELDARTRHLLALGAMVTESELETPGHGGAESSLQEAATAAAVVGTGFEILRSALSAMTAGDIGITRPTSEIGVTWPAKPSKLRFNTGLKNRLIISYRETHPLFGYEFVNVRLRCHVQFNGPEVTATFSFDAEGKRSRLARTTSITINNPLSLETRTTPAEWQRMGVTTYPVVRVPVEFRIDRPWPLSNYNATFDLLLSGMYGFGAARDRCYIVNRRVCWDTECRQSPPVCG